MTASLLSTSKWMWFENNSTYLNKSIWLQMLCVYRNNLIWSGSADKKLKVHCFLHKRQVIQKSMHIHVRCLQKHEVRNWERFLGDRREGKSGQKVGLMIILNADFGINCTTRLMFVVYALRCISKSVQKFEKENRCVDQNVQRKMSTRWSRLNGMKVQLIP